MARRAQLGHSTITARSRHSSSCFALRLLKGLKAVLNLCSAGEGRRWSLPKADAHPNVNATPHHSHSGRLTDQSMANRMNANLRENKRKHFGCKYLRMSLLTEPSTGSGIGLNPHYNTDKPHQTKTPPQGFLSLRRTQ